MTRQTMVVTIDVTGKTDAELMTLISALRALPEDGTRLKYNIVEMPQDDVITANHAVIDIVYRARRSAP